ncbi:MAG: CDP-alcohol phosphatidyltransferase family protein [Chloroflexota bacterium]|nr:CDP-alcohol phosphatidyltransferase family protein [Chloroflexota bacterium]
MTDRSFVSPATRSRVRGLAVPVALALGRLGLTPNGLTVVGFLGTCAAAAAAAYQQWFLAGLLVLGFGIFDLFDGALARATGRASKFGAFLDSTFDRAGETAIYLGIVAGFLTIGFREGAWLAAAAMAAAFLVSYTRAKAEGLADPARAAMGDVGVMPREVRLAILGIGLLIATGPLYEVPPAGALCAGVCDVVQGGSVAVALLLISVGSTVTVIQRILHVKRQLEQGEIQ